MPAKFAFRFVFAPMLVFVSAHSTASASAANARCIISQKDSVSEYAGPCEFWEGQHGSFHVAPQPLSRDMLGTMGISVYIVHPGEAQVRGLSRDGVNSFWGVAIRSKREPACWVSVDFTLCVYKNPKHRKTLK